ncbi:MAG TPA: hypothetical protein VM099_02595 [Gemmatimonadaceae bacterium]|nr:hypothetical protein [Gemmatimonadaceae bacterium]
MTSPRVPGSALLRLMWRPAAPMMLFPLFLAMMYPFLKTAGGPASMVAAMSSGFATLPLRAAFWMGCATVPATAGAIVGFVMREPLHSPMGWMLPGYARRLSPPMYVIAVLVSLFISIPVARVSNPAVTIAAFCVCLFAFSCGWVVFDPAASRLHRWASVTLLLLMVFCPRYFVQAAEEHPLYFGFASLAVALLSIGLFTTKEVVRLRALLPTTAGRMNLGVHRRFTSGRAAWATTRGYGVDILSLLRAGIFETHGGRRFSYAGSLVWTVIVVIAMSVLTASPFNIMMIVLFCVGMTPGHLKNAFPYPISRGRRAKAFFMSSLFDTFAAAATAVAGVVLVLALGFWRTDPDAMRDSPARAIAAILSLALFAPVAQAAMAPGFSQSQKTIATKNKIFAVAFVFVWILVALTLERILFPETHSVPNFQWVSLTVAFVLIQTAFWIYLRWYFAKKDLF